MPEVLSNGVEVPTLKEFQALEARVRALENQLKTETASGEFDTEAGVWRTQNCGWRPSRIHTSMPMEIQILATGFRARSTEFSTGRLLWVAIKETASINLPTP
ncbi:hypothetical protein [uncultured Hyphomicrobium sp.]|uniref:hypothetical protein n=1 Tax=uncultured Hyphomicrobium sp. TaxID=194373 RepID=UPI0025D6982D|nr:hypothetical protein [uncultured Hyphomicrobium sp.]